MLDFYVLCVTMGNFVRSQITHLCIFNLTTVNFLEEKKERSSLSVGREPFGVPNKTKWAHVKLYSYYTSLTNSDSIVD